MARRKSKTAASHYDADYHRFFELIGLCITRYQSVEDHLADVFSAALGGNRIRNRAMFEVVRGLATKLALIDAVLLESNDERRSEWKAIRREVEKTNEERSGIAHSSPVSTGHITIVLSEDKNSRKVANSRQWMEARKSTKSQRERVWKAEDLSTELIRLDRLFSAEVAFIRLLQGETPVEHLSKALRELIGSSESKR